MANTKQLFINLKGQDALRQWFSQRGTDDGLALKFVSLGDSDVNYELSQQVENMDILPAPYNTPKIKYKMAYEGLIGNINGRIETLVRYINASGDVLSLYSYPPDETFYTGHIPPTLKCKKDFDNLTFQDSIKEGYVIFFQTLPDNFYDENTVPLRLVEEYEVKIDNLPAPIEIKEITTTGVPDPNTDPLNLLNDAMFVTTLPHGLVQGKSISLKVIGNDALNGIWEVDVNTSTTFWIKDSNGVRQPNLVANVTGNAYIWDTVIDTDNGSMAIAKHNVGLLGEINGRISVRGKTSGIVKYISFNY